jgi:hypothetical protein
MPILYRTQKGSPLTITEADDNFQYIESQLALKLNADDYSAAKILERLLTVDGTDSGLDAQYVNGLELYSTTLPSISNKSSIVARNSSGNFIANMITSNVTGNVTGNLTGNVTGNVTGTATGLSTVLAVTSGGTGTTTVEGIRTLIGLNTMGLQPATNVTITGGSITGIAPLSINSGGTGSSSISIARQNLGLIIGTDVQPFASILTSLTALSTNGLVVKSADNTLISRSITAGTNISVSNGNAISGNPTISLISSPALSGTPTAPTATAGTNTTQIATTAFVKTADDALNTSLRAYVDAELNNFADTVKAWVVFNGSSLTIKAQRNVSSITQLGFGYYRINITPGVFANGNFAASGMTYGDFTFGFPFAAYINSTATTLDIYTMNNYTNNPYTVPGDVRVVMFA